jgi:hypothetical protein
LTSKTESENEDEEMDEGPCTGSGDPDVSGVIEGDDDGDTGSAE